MILASAAAPSRSRTVRQRLRPGLASVAALVLAGLSAGLAVAADRSIEMRDFAFTPGTVEVRVGDTVTWTNTDGVEHDAKATGGAFATGLLGTGGSASIRFQTAGTYAFACTPHPSMTGTVVVRAAAGGAGGGAAPPTDSVAPLTEASDGSLSLAHAGLGAVFVLSMVLGLRRQRRPDRA